MTSASTEEEDDGSCKPCTSQRLLLESELYCLWPGGSRYYPSVWAYPSRNPTLSVSHLWQNLCRNDRNSLLWTASFPGYHLGMSSLAGRTQQPSWHSSRERHQRRD